ncbi:MAG: putative transcriptional regulator [Acidimicrobiaceae bacterium]|jgi:putative transcriptional regulator|nr:putative transcriptional regulator [Acidimicrobiaceae bacterium]
MIRSSLKGQLLVATPLLGDANFERAVILLLEHTEDGAVGVVLNRPSANHFVDPLPDWYGFAAYPPVVFVGGPVGQGSAIGLARARHPEPIDGIEGWNQVVGSVGTVDLTLDPDDVPVGIEEVRVFSGYAGWGGGQLEDEVESGAWFVIDAEQDDALSTNPDGLWRWVLRRQTGKLAVFANFPHDPTLN